MKFVSLKLKIFSYPLIATFVLGAQKNRLIETVLLSTHNIYFGLELRKLFLITHSYLQVCYVTVIGWPKIARGVKLHAMRLTL